MIRSLTDRKKRTVRTTSESVPRAVASEAFRKDLLMEPRSLPLEVLTRPHRAEKNSFRTQSQQKRYSTVPKSLLKSLSLSSIFQVSDLNFPQPLHTQEGGISHVSAR